MSPIVIFALPAAAFAAAVLAMEFRWSRSDRKVEGLRMKWPD